MFIAALVIAAASVGIDQLIKWYINANVGLNEVRKFIPSVISITHIRNKGAAWSIMSGKTWFLIALPCIVVAAAVWYMYKNRHGSKLCLLSLGLILGGGIGNLIDRIRMHEVIDYIKCDLFSFPIFNFADICVVVGAVMFCIYMFFFDENAKKESMPREKKDAE